MKTSGTQHRRATILFTAALVSAGATACGAGGDTTASESTTFPTGTQTVTTAAPMPTPATPSDPTTPATPPSSTSSERPSSGSATTPSTEHFDSLAERHDPGPDDLSPRHEVSRLTKITHDGDDTLLVVNRVTWTWCHLPSKAPTPECGGTPDEYRITDENPKLRSYRLTPSATVMVRDDDVPRPHTSDLAGLRDRVAHAPGAAQDGLLVVLRHDDDGSVTGISEVFRP